ncbi:MAG: TolC family protein, partial [Vicinamibacterales bacterium]
QQLVAEAEIQLFDAQAAVEDAMDQLRLLFGRGLEYQFVVTQGIPRDVRPIPPEIAVERAREHRIDLRSAEARLDDAERDIRYARNQLLPQLDVNVALTRRETTDSLRTAFGLDEFKFATFFAVSMPLDRTPQTLALHNALIDRDRQTRATEMLRLRIVIEVRRAARQQQRLVRGLEVADTSLEFAEQEVELARLRYQRGLSNNLDVVTAEAGLLNASSRRITLLADLAVSRLTLLAAMGTLDPREDVR